MTTAHKMPHDKATKLLVLLDTEWRRGTQWRQRDEVNTNELLKKFEKDFNNLINEDKVNREEKQPDPYWHSFLEYLQSHPELLSFHAGNTTVFAIIVRCCPNLFNSLKEIEETFEPSNSVVFEMAYYSLIGLLLPPPISKEFKKSEEFRWILDTAKKFEYSKCANPGIDKAFSEAIHRQDEETIQFLLDNQFLPSDRLVKLIADPSTINSCLKVNEINFLLERIPHIHAVFTVRFDLSKKIPTSIHLLNSLIGGSNLYYQSHKNKQGVTTHRLGVQTKPLYHHLLATINHFQFLYPTCIYLKPNLDKDNPELKEPLSVLSSNCVTLIKQLKAQLKYYDLRTCKDKKKEVALQQSSDSTVKNLEERLLSLDEIYCLLGKISEIRYGYPDPAQQQRPSDNPKEYYMNAAANGNLPACLALIKHYLELKNNDNALKYLELALEIDKNFNEKNINSYWKKTFNVENAASTIRYNWLEHFGIENVIKICKILLPPLKSKMEETTITRSPDKASSADFKRSQNVTETKASAPTFSQNDKNNLLLILLDQLKQINLQTFPIDKRIDLIQKIMKLNINSIFIKLQKVPQIQRETVRPEFEKEIYMHAFDNFCKCHHQALDEKHKEKASGMIVFAFPLVIKSLVKTNTIRTSGFESVSNCIDFCIQFIISDSDNVNKNEFAKVMRLMDPKADKIFFDYARKFFFQANKMNQAFHLIHMIEDPKALDHQDRFTYASILWLEYKRKKDSPEALSNLHKAVSILETLIETAKLEQETSPTVTQATTPRQQHSFFPANSHPESVTTQSVEQKSAQTAPPIDAEDRAIQAKEPPEQKAQMLLKEIRDELDKLESKHQPASTLPKVSRSS